MEIFRTFIGRVSLTSDTWPSTFKKPILCVTIHWIDDEWFIQERIICFEAREESHNCFNIKTRIVSCCKNFHLIDKIFSLSLDNVTANTKAMEFLKKDPSIILMLGGYLRHIRCHVHILHLCVQEGLVELQPLVEPIRSVIKWIRVARTAKRAFKAKLLHIAITYCDVLHDLYNESRTGSNLLINNEDWSLDIHGFFQSFDSATNISFYVYEPNIHMVILECIRIIYSINQTT
ncbi:putative AC transposase [Bienertia sinuspersici]